MQPLSPAEILFIWRFRKDLTAEEAAYYWGVNYSRYRAWEAGSKGYSMRVPLGYAPTLREKLIILRRRAKLTQAQLAEKMGVSRQWLSQMEQGHAAVEKLGEFWAKQL